jgi:hypothetical protein
MPYLIEANFQQPTASGPEARNPKPENKFDPGPGNLIMKMDLKNCQLFESTVAYHEP